MPKKMRRYRLEENPFDCDVVYILMIPELFWLVRRKLSTGGYFWICYYGMTRDASDSCLSNPNAIGINLHTCI